MYKFSEHIKQNGSEKYNGGGDWKQEIW